MFHALPASMTIVLCTSDTTFVAATAIDATYTADVVPPLDSFFDGASCTILPEVDINAYLSQLRMAPEGPDSVSHTSSCCCSSMANLHFSGDHQD
mmetsp:Transcript_1436/g.2238  ORF Transcript_1436/g.2238 Transcript_1436/m.2238 type:complete len:95 (-) Transcript_1436:397-681(-)